MNNKTKVGKIVNTHGIKGEIKVLLDIFLDNNFFETNHNIYIKNNCYQITSYRQHKKFYLLTLKNFTNINDVLFLKNQSIYVKKISNEVLDINELVGLSIFQGQQKIGVVSEIVSSGQKKFLVLKNNNLIPYDKNFIVAISKSKIEVKNL